MSNRNPTIVLDVSDLGTRNDSLRSPVYIGVLGLIVVEATVFASLVSSYFYLQSVSIEWPPAGTKEPELLLPSINTLILLLSAVVVFKADQAARVGHNKKLVAGLAVGNVMAIAFLALKAVEYSHVEYRWDSHAYGSIHWMIMGFHAAHVIALALKTFIVGAMAVGGHFTPDNSVAVQTNGIYWYFVAAIWLPLYVVLYWMPGVLP